MFATTWLLLFNLTASLLVLGCVVLTLINVGGFIHFWGLTIDTVSCTNIIISIGLCVDYSAHIAHAFLANQAGPNCLLLNLQEKWLKIAENETLGEPFG